MYLEEVTVDGAWGSALEAAAAAEIFNVSVVIFIGEGAYVLNRNGVKGTVFLKFHARHWTAFLRDDMPEKVTAAKNVPALSSEQGEQIDKLAKADTKDMKGGDRTRTERSDERREHQVNTNTGSLGGGSQVRRQN